MSYLINFIDKDVFLCPICCNEYNCFNYKPICISCGHTLCEECINLLITNDTITCPIDKKKIKITTMVTSIKNKYDNISLLNILKLIDCINIDYKVLTKFDFYFCINCNIFISLYVKNVHENADHKILPFRKFLCQKVDYIKKISHNLSNEFQEENFLLLNIFVLLFYLYDPRIIAYLNFKPTKTDNIFKKDYSYIGHSLQISSIEYEPDENLFFLTKFIFLFKDDQNLSIKKGNIVFKNQEVIQGFFGFNNKNEVKKALGIFKHNDVYFLGMIDLNDDNYQIKFKYGMLIDNKNNIFHFGKFNEELVYPEYDCILGEEVDLKTLGGDLNNFKCIRKVKNKQEATVNPLKFTETLLKNSYYKVSNKVIGFQKSVFLELPNKYEIFHFAVKKSKNKFPSKIYLSTNPNTEENPTETIGNEEFVYGTIFIKNFNKDTDDYSYRIDPIIPKLNILDLELKDTYISFLNNDNKNNISIKFYKGFSFIVSPFFKVVKNNDYGYQGYLFKIKPKYINKNGTTLIIENQDLKNFFELKNLSLKNLYINLEKFLNASQKIIIESAQYFNIYYQDFIKENDDRMNNNYYEIDCEEGKISLFEVFNYKIKHAYNKSIKEFKIVDLMPDVYNKSFQYLFHQNKNLIVENMLTEYTNAQLDPIEFSIKNKPPLEKQKSIKFHHKEGCRCLIF